MIHLLVAGTRVKSIRSHLSVNDLARLVGQGAVNAGLPPLPAPEQGEAVEVDRVVSRAGTVSLGHHVVLAAEILAGRQLGVRLETSLIMFFDLDSRELLRTRPNPLTSQQIQRLRGIRKAGPPPRPYVSRSRCSAEPRTPAWSWSAARKSPSAVSISTRPSPSASPTPPGDRTRRRPDPHRAPHHHPSGP